MIEIKLSNNEGIKKLDKARKIRNIAAYALIFNLLTPFISANLFVLYFFWSFLFYSLTQLHAVRIWRLVNLNHPLYGFYEGLLGVPWSLKVLDPISKSTSKKIKKI